MIATAQVVDTIHVVVGPYVGQSMVRAATRAQIEALGITTETIARTVAADLVRRVGRGLTVFVGTAETLRLLAEIAEALDLRL